MSKVISTKEILLEHSLAKVKLFECYLSIYLNILYRAKIVDKIIIADLFAGEGIYKNGEKGSSIKAFEAILRHLKLNNGGKKTLFLINDPEKSKIETTKYKVDRIQEWIEKFELLPNLKISYSKDDFSKLMPSLLSLIDSMRICERALIFIDPWGYKEIKPIDLKKLLNNEKVEILLFLPISFMYRFAKTVLLKNFVGSEPLENFLIELLGNERDRVFKINSVEEFIIFIREKFKQYLNISFVDDFILTTKQGNIYCLLFFSFNKIGFRKIIEAKWTLDSNYGRGLNKEENYNLFSGSNYNNYNEELSDYILNSSGRTNEQLLDFGFEHRFLPKHTKEVLDRLKQKGKIIVESIDGQPVKGYYIDNANRKVLIKKV